jgi:hypothetical protein
MADRYGTMLGAMPYTLVHLTGDFPLVDYSFAGKCILCVALVFAVGVVSVPTGILASGFTKELKVYRQEQRILESSSRSKVEKLIKAWVTRRRFLKLIECAKHKDRELKAAAAKAEKEGQLPLQVINFLEQKTAAGRAWKKLMFVLIITNVLAVILESLPGFKADVGPKALEIFEFLSVCCFTFEYLLNVWSAPANKAFDFKRRNYIWSFWGIVDCSTVLPYWLEMVLKFWGIPFDAFIFRVFRLLRILQMEDYVASFTLLDDAWYKCRDSMFAAGFMALLIWICGSVLFYEFEKDNPRMEGAFANLPSSMYFTIIFLGGEWAVIDFTPQGQVVCLFYCVMGIGIYGIPVGAVFEAFSDVLAGDEDEEEGEGEEAAAPPAPKAVADGKPSGSADKGPPPAAKEKALPAPAPAPQAKQETQPEAFKKGDKPKYARGL